MLIAVVPFTAAVSADSPNSAKIAIRYDVQGNVYAVVDAIPGARRYEATFWQHHPDGGLVRLPYQHDYIDVDDQTNVGVFRWGYSNAWMYIEKNEEYNPPLFAVQVRVLDWQGDVIFNEIRDFRAPFERYLDGVKNAQLSASGVLTFDPVEDAATYQVAMSRNGIAIVSMKSENPWFDLKNYLIDNYRYSISIYAYPEKLFDKYCGSDAFYGITYDPQKEIDGTVEVNGDRSLTFTGFLLYLHEVKPELLKYQWHRFVLADDGTMGEGDNDNPNAGQWVDIPASQIGNYDPSLLRVTVTATGFNGSVTSRNNAFTNPDIPYIATDFEGLRAVFNMERAEGQTVYIRLGNDITYDEHTPSLINYRLVTNGGNVDLNLCGYKLLCLDYKMVGGEEYATGVKSYTRTFITANNGKLIVRDSRRIDGSGNIVDGELIYKFDSILMPNVDKYTEKVYGVKLQSFIIRGDVEIHGGKILNHSHIDDNQSTYGIYGHVGIYGGEVSAGLPLSLLLGDDESCGLYGGALRVKSSDYAVYLSMNHVTESQTYYGSVYPTFANTKIYNETGKDYIAAFKLYLANSGWDGMTDEEIFGVVAKCYYKSTYAVVDGTSYPGALVGMVTDSKEHIYGPTDYYCLGPGFTSTFELRTPATLDNIDYTVTPPQIGKLPDYTVGGHNATSYDAQLVWYYKDTPHTYAIWDENALFRSGVEYRAIIWLYPKAGVDAPALGSGKKITINGEDATQFANSFYKDFWIDDDYRDVWIGSVRVGHGNRGDVLGDGTVQYYEAGEYTPTEMDKGYGYTAEDFADTPVLVLNDLRMDRADYHEDPYDPAQIYLGESIFVVLHGENSLWGATNADGIHVEAFRSVTFLGDGSLTADMEHDTTALSGFSSVVIFDEIVDVTLCGLHGISMGSDHDDDPEVMVQGDAFVYCRSYKTGVTSANPVSQCYAAFDCDYLSVYGCGKIVCEAEGQTAAMKTAGSWFLDDVFDIEIIKIGEYCEPYGVAGLNYPGEVDESECRYVSIWRGHGEISHLAVTMPVPRAGERIGYDGFRALGRGYGIEDFTDGRRWLNGVKWFVGTGMIDLKIYDENYFEAGETYTVYISLVINDGRYSFVDPDYATAEVNGERADITVYSNENFGVYFSFTVPEEPVIPAGRLGDVNDDGDIGAVDYLMVKRNVLGTFDLDDGQTYRADVNRSGDITAVDYLMIKRHVLGSYTIG